MKIDIHISPCPNDTFMFDAMLNGRIDTGGLEFEVAFADIEQLNAGVLGGSTAVSKISYAVLPEIADGYAVLDSGSALGRGNGPLLVSRPGARLDGKGLRVAVPGAHTTANMLLRKFFPQFADITPVLFSEIAAKVASGKFDAGVLIHEGRFTYKEKGLALVADLGRLWEENVAMPLPLGGIVASRSLPAGVTAQVEDVLRRSVRYALDNPEASRSFVRAHAQEMDDAVMRSHIALFVNDYSVSLGPEGKNAVSLLTGLDAADIFA